jgi:HSP20 family protein
MTVITRWDPFREFSTLQDRMNRLFQQSYNEGSNEALTSSTFAPSVENNTLTVQGERKFEKEEKEENYRRIERQYGSFTRSFSLPPTVNPESVQANYEKGVLKIKLEKKAEAKPKQIKVNVGGEKTLEAKGATRAA